MFPFNLTTVPFSFTSSMCAGSDELFFFFISTGPHLQSGFPHFPLDSSIGMDIIYAIPTHIYTRTHVCNLYCAKITKKNRYPIDSESNISRTRGNNLANRCCVLYETFDKTLTRIDVRRQKMYASLPGTRSVLRTGGVEKKKRTHTIKHAPGTRRCSITDRNTF